MPSPAEPRKKVYWIEVQYEGEGAPTTSEIAQALGPGYTVVDVSELEACWACDGVEVHKEDCVLTRP